MSTEVHVPFTNHVPTVPGGCPRHRIVEGSPRRGGGEIATLRALLIPPGPSALALLAALEGVIDGRDAPVIPVPSADPRDCEALTRGLRVGDPIDDDIALVVSTSGTTGAPKGAMLTAAALVASASATHDRLGGPGTWLLALPSHHIAGIQVLVRSVLAGTVPAELDLTDGFDPAALAAAVTEMPGGRRYTALVANQLAKALADPAARAALTELDAVLLGGGPAPIPVLDAAAEAGVAVVRTYGSSETAGGCVYDGAPLDGVTVRIEDPGPAGEGRIVIGGATVARGYRNPATPDPFAELGWFRTGDVGSTDDSGLLRVLGRTDDAISSGGLTIMPAEVEAVLIRHPALSDCAVFGVDDDRLGQRVAAAVVVAPGLAAPILDDIREFVCRSLHHTAAPRELHVLDELPRRGIGKLDRRALRDQVSAQ